MNEPKFIIDMRNDAFELFQSQPNNSATYEELYEYLSKKGHNLTKYEGAQIKYLDQNVLSIFNGLTQANIKEMYFGAIDHPNDEKYIGITGNGRLETVKFILKQSYPIHPSILQARIKTLNDNEEKRLAKEKEIQIEKDKEEAKQREHKTFEITKESFSWAKTGIWSTVILASIQIGISIYDIWWRDYDHETKMIQLDSLQVEQNKKIIELLQQKK